MIELPSKIGWRKREDGLIVTWDLPNGAEHAPMLDEKLRPGFDRVEAQWGDMCRRIGAKHHLEDGILQMTIWRESGGNPRAFRQETDKDGEPIYVNGRPLTGVGLTQITSPSLKKNHTDAELFNPELNVEIAAGYLAYLASRPDTKGPDGLPDIPRIAAAFNAGGVHPATTNPWGMRSTGNHVSAEVAAYNYFVASKMADVQREAAMAFAKNFGLLDLIPARAPLDTLPDGEEPS